MKILVTGAGGFIGHHLAKRLRADGHFVRGVDIKHPEYESHTCDEFKILDLTRESAAAEAVWGVEQIFHLAANMGGIGFIENHKAEIVRDNTRIDLNVLEAARAYQVKRVLYSSSACVYPKYRQESPEIEPLKEEHAYPADAEDGYGWQKLYTERMCRHYREDFGLDTRIVRFHNIYGPLGTYDGGREKSPAAICRKVALAKDGDAIEVWGDGKQTRSYCYIDDCVEGLIRLMDSDFHDPLNLGTSHLVTIDELIDTVAKVAGKKIDKKYDLSKPQGVRGRNADLTLLREKLGWEPQMSLEDGLRMTYWWIEGRIRAR
jgi:nucleoside-diphosphate-sugar epimerase